MIAVEDPTRIILPSDRFYWGVLDIHSLPGRRLGSRRSGRPRQLHYLLEPLLPGVALESVHAVFASVGAAHVIACAIDRDVLRDEASLTATMLVPDALPRCVLEQIGDAQPPPPAERFNLLIGEFTPRPIRAAQRQIVRTCLFLTIAFFLAIVVGLERRIRADQRDIDSASKALDQGYESVLEGDSFAGVQPPHVQLTAELRRLEQTRSNDAAKDAALFDAALALQALLTRWPNEMHVTSEIITIAPSTITLRALLPVTETEAAVASFREWGNWRRAQPEIMNRDGTSTVTVRFDRTGEPGT